MTKTKATISEFLYSSPPPQDTALEEAILGSLLIDSRAMETAALVFGDSNPFYLDKHRAIYDTLLTMHRNFRKIDTLTAADALRKAGTLESIGGPYALVELTDKVGSTANLEAHCRIIQQLFIQREVIRVSAQLTQMAHDRTTDALDLLEMAQQAMQDFSTGIVQPMHIDAAKAAREYLTHAEEIKQGREVFGLPTGFADVDEILGGMAPGHMIVLAARPGMGKTAFVLNIAKNLSRRTGKKTGVFSMEMSTRELMQRLIASEGQIPLSYVKNPKTAPAHEYQAITAAANAVSGYNMLIDDTPGLTYQRLFGKARAMRKEGAELIVLDYLQLMAGDAKSKGRTEEMTTISRMVKVIAKELQIPIIALSQLSRAVETRGGDKRPILSDLRESGGIEQDADVVGFLYRPEYYEIKEDASGNSVSGMAELIIAKNRHGGLGSVWLRFNGPTVTFSNLSQAPASDFAPHRPQENEDLPF